MANRSAVVCVNKFKSSDNKASKALLTKRWVEVINLSEKLKKANSRPS